MAILDVQVVDVGPPAVWVKINVRETNDFFEVYALVSGLSREEVRVQSDPAGRLVISGQPKQLDNFGVLLPSRRWSTYLLELISFRPTLVSPFMGVFMFMCPLRSRISESTKQDYL